MTNVAVVVLDTLRKDAFERHFDWLSGRRFERAYSTANWTVPAHASLFTGKYPSEVGVHAKHTQCDMPEPTLAERLRNAGYTTRAFSANTNITGHFGFDRGFTDFRTPRQFARTNDDDLFDWLSFNRTTHTTGAKKYAEALYRCITEDVQTIPSLKNGLRLLREGAGIEFGGTQKAIKGFNDTEFGDREFFFLNLMEAHEPYRAPAAYRTTEEPALTDSVGDISIGTIERARTRRAYDDCVRYLSDIYQDLFDRLTEKFEYVITLSDHGELLGEDNAWGHEHGIHPELTHVPLVISGNGLGGTCKRTVNLLDVHSTVLELAGIDADGRGSDLTGEVFSQECLTEFLGLTSWSKRKLRRNGYEERVKQYDSPLRGYAAPVSYYGYETMTGFEECGECDATEPKKRLDTLASRLDVRHTGEDVGSEIPEEVRAQLERLGYA